MALSPSQLRQAIEHLQQGDWRAAHAIVQKDENSPLACWAHGIVHLMEGDLPNARYWYGEAGRTFPASPSVETELRKLTERLSRPG